MRRPKAGELQRAQQSFLISYEYYCPNLGGTELLKKCRRALDMVWGAPYEWAVQCLESYDLHICELLRIQVA